MRLQITLNFTTPCVLIANCTICLQMILNTVLGLMGYKSLVQIFNPVHLGREQKNWFSTCFDKYSDHSVLRWSFPPVSAGKIKKRNFDRGQPPTFKIPLLLQMVDHFEAFKKSSLQLKTTNFSNPSRWATSLSWKILREILYKLYRASPLAIHCFPRIQIRLYANRSCKSIQPLDYQ